MAHVVAAFAIHAIDADVFIAFLREITLHRFVCAVRVATEDGMTIGDKVAKPGA